MNDERFPIRLSITGINRVDKYVSPGRSASMTLKLADLQALVERGKDVRFKVEGLIEHEAFSIPTDERRRILFRALLVMLPTDIHPVVEALEHRIIRNEMDDWYKEYLALIEAIVDLAEERIFDDGWINGERVVCPLCGAKPRDAMPTAANGFTHPEGLSRHLEGRGNVRWCPVTNALLYWLRDEEMTWRAYRLREAQRRQIQRSE